MCVTSAGSWCVGKVGEQRLMGKMAKIKRIKLTN